MRRPASSKHAIPAFARMGEHAQRLVTLQKVLREILPTLPITVVACEHDVLVVGAAHAAVAAKIRQIEPSLIEALRQRGWPLRQIRFKPQIPARNLTPTREYRPGPTSQAVAALDALAHEVSEPKLQEALRRLSARHSPRTPNKGKG